MKIAYKDQQGFSLVEMIVSLAVFSIVVTISVGAMLVLISTNQQLQREQSVMTNLSFALDSMTREIRTGTNYFCDSRQNFNSGADKIFLDSTDLDAVLGDRTRDCFDGNNSDLDLTGVAFKETGGSITGNSGRILYFYDADTNDILRRVGDGPAQSIISSGVLITDAEFFVTGSNKMLLGAVYTYVDQATVTIYIEAREVGDVSAKPYRIQTTVSQRTLDI